MNCRSAREAMVATVRQAANEAQRLLLDEHLAGCAACREERGRWALMEQLRDEPPQHLTGAARARVLRRLTQEAGATSEATIRPRRLWPVLTLAGAAAAAVLLTVFQWQHGRQPQPGSPAVAATPSTPQKRAPVAPAQEQEIRATAPGARAFPGVKVAYQGGTTLRVRAEQRRIVLVDGEIDVDVTPGGPGRFIVSAPRFTVEVLGTHFVVRPDSVRTLHGLVRVLDLQGTELALLHAGESWQLPQPAPAAAAPASVSAGTAARTVIPDSPTRPVAAQPASRSHAAVARPSPRAPETAPESPWDSYPAALPASPPVRSAAQLLAEARGLLGSGETVRARERITAALAAHPTARQQATADLLGADSLLVESRRDLALAAYQRTADRFASFPEGETASFAAAQLLLERGSRSEARAALEKYMSRYPAGRFVREVRERLSALTQP